MVTVVVGVGMETTISVSVVLSVTLKDSSPSQVVSVMIVISSQAVSREEVNIRL